MNALSAMKADAAACNARLTSLRATPSLEARVDGLLAAVAVLQGQVAELERNRVAPKSKAPALSPHVMEVVRAVAGLHDLTPDQVLSVRQSKRESWARFNVWHHLHAENPERYSLAWLGRKFERNYKSISYGIAQWEAKGRAYMETL